MLELLFGRKKKEVGPSGAEQLSVPSEQAPETETSNEQVAETAKKEIDEKLNLILKESGEQAEPTHAGVEADAKELGAMTDAKSRVNQLVELAQVKGVAHAVSVTRRMNDLYVLDQLHDKFVDEFRTALVEKGLIPSE